MSDLLRVTKYVTQIMTETSPRLLTPSAEGLDLLGHFSADSPPTGLIGTQGPKPCSLCLSRQASGSFYGS